MILGNFCRECRSEAGMENVLVFLGSIITNSHKLCGIEQYKRILSQFRSSDSKIEMSVGPHLLPGSMMNPSLPFPGSVGSWHSLICGSMPSIHTSFFTWLSSLCLCLLGPLIRIFSAHLGSTLMHYILISRYVTKYLSKDQLSNKVSFWLSRWSWFWEDTIRKAGA